MPMKILIADDHPMVMRDIGSLLLSKNYKVVSLCYDGIEAWSTLLLLKPDIAILDHNMPGMSGMEIAEKVLHARLPVKIVLLTMHKERSLLEKAIAIGVQGYLLKDFALHEIDDCMKMVCSGMQYYSHHLTEKSTGNEYLKALTPAEQKILHKISSNNTPQEIADMLVIPLGMVEEYQLSIITKLGLQPGADSIALWAAENNISHTFS